MRSYALGVGCESDDQNGFGWRNMNFVKLPKTTKMVERFID